MSKSGRSNDKENELSLKRADDPERRRSKRMAILDSFSLFAVYPPKGPHRLRIHDISDAGIGFDLDIEEEAPDFAVQAGQTLNIQLYLNQGLFLPLSVAVRRVAEKGGVRHIGAEFVDKSSKSHIALLAFLDMLDALTAGGRLEEGPMAEKK